MSQIADKLDEARKLIEQPGGWCQGDYEYNGGLCAIGAIRKVTSGDPFTWSEEAGAAEGELYQTVGTLVDVWNDAAERTQGEVVAAFSEAAARVRARAAKSERTRA